VNEPKSPEEAIRIRELIDLQRRLSASKNPFIRRIGMLLAAGALDQHLSELSDHQIGQLMVDEVERELELFQPAAAICGQASRRLVRSSAGALGHAPQKRRSCPKCGNEMLIHFGIDEQDYFECVLLECGHRELVADQGEIKR
jgi:hypothetical protein